MPSIHALLKSAALLALAAIATSSSSLITRVDARSALVVADTEIVSLAINTTSRVATSNTISATRGTFMTVHFAEFNLAAGDKVIVRDADGTTSYEYTGLGRGDTGLDGGFYSSRLPGNKAVVQYIPDSGSSSGAFGYRIDKITRSSTGAAPSKICGLGDQSKPAKCYTSNVDAPQAYIKSRAVVRLYINGLEGCTGWLIGSEGYMVTNHHCIYNDKCALQTDYEFDAEGAGCNDLCQSWGACRGTIVATGAQLIASDQALDYALVKLDTKVDLSKYGYFQLRTKGPVLDEQIYIPQHPQHWAKYIGIYEDGGDVARVKKIGTTICGDYTVGYTADTQGGSSGSPVIGAADNQVVALHNCGDNKKTCENGGTDSRTLLWHWKSKGISLKDAVADSTEEIPYGPWIPGYTAAPTPAPVTKAPAPSAPTPTTAPSPPTTPTPTTTSPSTPGTTPAPTAWDPPPALIKACAIYKSQTSCSTATSGKCWWTNGLCVPNPNGVTLAPTPAPETPAPTTVAPTPAPTTETPAPVPTTAAPTPAPTVNVCKIFKQEKSCLETWPGKCLWVSGVCVPAPATEAPVTPSPVTPAPSTEAPTPVPTTVAPVPTTQAPTPAPTPAPVPSTCVPSGGYCGNASDGAKCCASTGDYCQPWNPTYYQCRPINAKCGKQEVNVDFYGEDISTVYGLLPETCCDKCHATSGCKAYTFVNYNSDGRTACYLKKGSGERRTVAGTVSAVIVSVTPPPQVCASSGGACGSDRDGATCCPSGEYCQAWNQWYYQCQPLPAQCSQQFTDVDFYGSDIRTVLGLSPGECCNQCKQTAGCKAYTFVNTNPGSPACYLKSGTGNRRVVSGAVSGIVN